MHIYWNLLLAPETLVTSMFVKQQCVNVCIAPHRRFQLALSKISAIKNLSRGRPVVFKYNIKMK